MSDRTPPIAVCFFGITRSLARTLPSIERNILAPARAQGEVRVLAHLFRQKTVINARSGEHGDLDPEEYRLLKADAVRLEEPDLCLDAMGFEALKAAGDPWDDDFRSLRNLLHQLHSLAQVTAMAQEAGAQTVIFARPDLKYLDSLGYALRHARQSPVSALWLPAWQAWDGLNDRFAIAQGEAAIRAYGLRGAAAQDFVSERGQALHGEMLLAWRLAKLGIPLRDIDAYACRIRIDGSVAEKDRFPGPARRLASRWARRSGLKPAIRRLMGKPPLPFE